MFTGPMRVIPVFCIVTLLLLMYDKRLEAEPLPKPTKADELKQLNDPTLLVTHVSLESEWDQFKDGAERANWTFTGLWAWRVSDCQDWAIRFTLPFVYDRTDRGSGHRDTGGLGDVEIGTGTAFRLNDRWRTAGGIELHADTASNRALAEDVWRLKSVWGIAHDVTDWLTLTLNAEYNHSIAQQHNLPPQSYFELSLPATFILPYNWSIGARYKATVDFENGDQWTHTVNAGIAKRLATIPVVLSATLEKPLNAGAKNFQANFTIVYYFERYHSPK